ncbi:hemolysin activation/secretion protein [Bradyrhizobium sp. LB7.1]
MRILGAAFGVGLAACCIAPARAQVPSINPGVIQNDVDRQRRQLEQQSAPPKLNGPAVIGGEREKSQLLKPGGPKFRLRKVEFDGSKFITPAELDEIAKKYVGKNVDIASLLQLVADINAIYTERGIVTGIATLPEQDAKGGIVRVKLTEGRLQKTTIEGNKQTRTDYILQRVKEPEGEVLDVPQLNRDVIWFNRTNDVQIKALLQPGTSFGLTDLQFAVIEPPIDTLQLFTDNQGAENTGRWEGGAFYKRHGLFGVDDRLTFYGVRSDGNLNGNAAYSVPVNPWGGRVGVSYTEGKIKIIQGPFVALDVTGRSSQAAVNFSQPVWVTQNWLVLLNAAETEGKTVSRFATVAVTQDHYDKATAGLSVTNSGNTYSITVSPAVNYIEWQDHVLGNNRAFNTYTGSLIATSAAGPANFSTNVLASWQLHAGEAAAGRPDFFDRWPHHRARLSLQLGVR